MNVGFTSLYQSLNSLFVRPDCLCIVLLAIGFWVCFVCTPSGLGLCVFTVWLCVPILSCSWFVFLVSVFSSTLLATVNASSSWVSFSLIIGFSSILFVTGGFISSSPSSVFSSLSFAKDGLISLSPSSLNMASEFALGSSV